MYTALHLLRHLGQAGSDTHTTGPSQASITLLIFCLLFVGAAAILALIAACKLYQKAGRKWWEALVPIYNSYVLLKIIGRPGWWLILYFIFPVSLVVSIININDLAKSFGKGTGTTLLLIFFPFIMYPVMAFSSEYQYKGPSALEHETIPDTPYPTSTTSNQSSVSDTDAPTLPTHTEPAPTAPEVPSSTPPEDSKQQ